MSDQIQTALWDEVAEPDNPYAAAACYCSGYDVYGDLLGKASYIEYLYLLFHGERPPAKAAVALEILALALANPGPRDPSVHAAMAAGVGGSTSASALMAALAVGAGTGGGSREVYLAMKAWQSGDSDTPNRLQRLSSRYTPTSREVWPSIDRPPGFAAYGRTCPTPVLQTLSHLATALPDGAVAWLADQRPALEVLANAPLAFTGVAAAALTDLAFDPHQGEMLFLLMRLPGAAAHALEQQSQGFRKFPFFGLELQDDPDEPPQ